MSRIVLKLLNGIYGWIIGTVLVASVAYAGYSIWDNSQIYRAAEDVQDQVRQLKPDADADGGPGFDELRALNDDVVGWITVDGTNIDYPVLQGETNLTYMNKDVYGNFSLAGSIFLDTRNKADFSDNYSLIYGHNMDEHLMFGDLALFKDKDFFTKNTTATLMVPGESRDLKVAAVLQISAGTEEIFNPDRWKDNLKGLGEFLKENSVWYHSSLIEMLISQPGKMEVTSLVTCSDGSTNDRTVLILVRYNPDRPGSDDSGADSSDSNGPGSDNSNGSGSDDGDSAKTDSVEPGTGTSGTGADDTLSSSDTSLKNDIKGNGPKKTGDTQNPDFWMAVIVGIILFIAVFEGIDRYRSRHKE